MSNRNFFASILMACLLVIGFLGIAPVANAVSVGPSLVIPGESPGNNVVQIKTRGRGAQIYLPIAPSYLFYDYPYYYSRGYYPAHIGRGFVYFGYPYSYHRSRHYRTYGGQCAYWHRRCVANRGHNRGPVSPDRRQHFGACRCP